MNKENNNKVEALVSEIHQICKASNGEINALIMVHMDHGDGRTHCLQVECGSIGSTTTMLLEKCENEPDFEKVLFMAAAMRAKGVSVHGGRTDD
jgi:hypothetical protein